MSIESYFHDMTHTGLTTNTDRIASDLVQWIKAEQMCDFYVRPHYSVSHVFPASIDGMSVQTVHQDSQQPLDEDNSQHDGLLRTHVAQVVHCCDWLCDTMLADCLVGLRFFGRRHRTTRLSKKIRMRLHIYGWYCGHFVLNAPSSVSINLYF